MKIHLLAFPPLEEASMFQVKMRHWLSFGLYFSNLTTTTPTILSSLSV